MPLKTPDHRYRTLPNYLRCCCRDRATVNGCAACEDYDCCVGCLRFHQRGRSSWNFRRRLHSCTACEDTPVAPGACAHTSTAKALGFPTTAARVRRQGHRSFRAYSGLSQPSTKVGRGWRGLLCWSAEQHILKDPVAAPDGCGRQSLWGSQL